MCPYAASDPRRSGVLLAHISCEEPAGLNSPNWYGGSCGTCASARLWGPTSLKVPGMMVIGALLAGHGVTIMGTVPPIPDRAACQLAQRLQECSSVLYDVHGLCDLLLVLTHQP